MSDDSTATTDLPESLLDLERARVDARRALDVYVARVEIERRAAYPKADQIVERRTWTDEQNAHHRELRDAYEQAAAAVREHTVMHLAAVGGQLWVVEGKLRTAVPQVQVEVRRDKAGHESVRVLLGGVEQEEAES
jgi:hypothetical protein